MNLIRRTLTDGRIWKDTRRIFWFATLSSLMGSLNLFADSFIAGNLSTETVQAIAVVALNAPLVMTVNIILDVALTGHLSQSLNSGKTEHAQKSFDFALALSVVSIAITSVILYGVEMPLIHWRTADAQIIDLAQTYYWFQMGAILVGVYSSRYAVLLIAKGKQKRMTIVSIIVISSNIIISYLLAYPGGLEILGTGLGTLLSVMIGGCLRFYFAWSIREELGIKINIFRMFKAKLSQAKILKKTWMYLPYEMTYAIIIVGQSFILTNMFADGLDLIAISGGISFAVTGASGASTMMNKFISPLLGSGDTAEAKVMTEKILVVSTIRQFFVSLVFVSIFGFGLPYIHIYGTYDHQTLVHAGYIIVGVGLTAGVMAPSFFTGYTLASLSANPRRVMVMDLGATLASLLIYYLGSIVSSNWLSIMFTIMIHRILADLTMVSLIFRKDQYKSLKKEMA